MAIQGAVCAWESHLSAKGAEEKAQTWFPQRWDPEEKDWVCVTHRTRRTGDHRSQRAGALSPGSLQCFPLERNDYTTVLLYKHLEKRWGKKDTYFKKINGLRFRSKSQNDLFVLNLLQEEGCFENLSTLSGPCWLSTRTQVGWAGEPVLGRRRDAGGCWSRQLYSLSNKLWDARWQNKIVTVALEFTKKDSKHGN